MKTLIRSLSRLCYQALAIAALLAVAQILWQQTPSFMGQNMDTLVTGVLQFYPGAAVLEVLRVLGFTFLWTALLLVVRLAISNAFPRWKWASWVVLIAAYGFFAAASFIRYPALYAPFLGPTLRRILFRASFWIDPLFLQIAAFGLITLPLLIWVMMKRRRPQKHLGAATVAVLVLSLGATGATMPLDPAAVEGKRLVFLVGIDSLRADRFKDPDVMPNLSKLLADPQTVSMEDHIVGVPRTFPSWIEILQGRYSAQTGVRHMFPSLKSRDKEFVGLATAFRDAGYETTVVSDFAGDIFPRFEAGFQKVLCPHLSLTGMIRLSVDQSFPLFLPAMLTAAGRTAFPQLKESPVYSDPGHLVDEVLNATTKTKRDGHFITVFFSTAHFPYAAPYPYYRMYADPSYDGPYFFEKNPSLSGDATTLDSDDTKQTNRLYDGALRSIDDALGHLFSTLRNAGLWDDALFVVTADHGEDLYDGGNLQGHGEHLRGENVIKVPLLVKLPKSSPPARRNLAFTSRSIDIAPTVATLAKVKITDTRGTDLSPWILDAEKPAPRLLAYSETEIWFSRGGSGFFQRKRLDYPGISGLLSFDPGYSDDIVVDPKFERLLVTSRHRSLIDGRLKLIYMPTAAGVEYELYDRLDDPENRSNLVSSRPAEADRLKGELWALLKEIEKDAKFVEGYVLPPW